MSDEEIQISRDFILRATAKFPRGITRTTLAISVASLGVQLPAEGPDSLDAHLEYLVGAKLIERKPKAHTASLEMFGLTPAGDDYLRLRHLIT